jgi:hypothetical protein
VIGNENGQNHWYCVPYIGKSPPDEEFWRISLLRKLLTQVYFAYLGLRRRTWSQVFWYKAPNELACQNYGSIIIIHGLITSWYHHIMNGRRLFISYLHKTQIQKRQNRLLC